MTEKRRLEQVQQLEKTFQPNKLRFGYKPEKSNLVRIFENDAAIRKTEISDKLRSTSLLRNRNSKSQ